MNVGRWSVAFLYWGIATLIIGVGGAFVANTMLEGVGLEAPCVSLASVCAAMFFQKKLEEELLMSELDKHWNDNKGYQLGKSSTLDAAWNDATVQKHLRSVIFHRDTKDFLLKVGNTNVIAIFVAAATIIFLLVAAAKTGYFNNPADHVLARSDGVLILLASAIPWFVLFNNLWGPSFFLINRNKGLLS